MTRVVVFTDDDSYRESFAPVERSRTYSLEFYRKDELRTVLRNLSEPAVLYYDLEGDSDHSRDRTLRYLTRGPEHAVGVIDGSEAVPDPAGLFHAGAVDYLGPNALETGVHPKRVKRAVSLFEQAYSRNGDDALYNSDENGGRGWADGADREGPAGRPGNGAPVGANAAGDAALGDNAAADHPAADGAARVLQFAERTALSPPSADRLAGYRPPGLDWEAVRSSREYTFLMLYAELDLENELRRIWSTRRIERLAGSFRSYLESELAGHNARSWMWSDTAGLFLIPFDGRYCPVLRDCVRLMLSQTLLAVERLGLSHAVGFRLALTLGDTTYEDSGRTGGIISESVNFVFHLGKRYLEPGRLVVDEEALRLSDPRLHSLFSFDGRYEQRELYRMHRVL